MSFQEKFRDICASIGVRVAAVALLLGLFSVPAFSQLNLGRIIGSVTDATGAVIAGAKVTVTDQDRGTTRELMSDEAGAFAAPSLIPGNYTVRVEFMGFNISERKNVEVQVGSDSRVDIALQAGSQNQTVTVTEAVPLMNTTSATLGNVVEGHDFTDLPIIGRSYQSMLQFQPGVVTRPGGGSNGHSSNGLRSDGNNWLFEGIYSGGVRTAGSIINTNSNTGDGASVIPPDSIQEIGVSFQNKAEFGWKPGVASNVGIKSGTNSIHGTAFAVGQTGAINARNPFNPPPNAIPLLAYEQYGATIGGPIKKDKLFYYVAYEGMQFTQGVPTTHVVPTTALETGATSLSIPAAYLDMAAKGIIPSSAIDANGNVTSPSSLTLAQQLSAKLVSDGIFQTGAAANGVFNYGFTASRDPNKNLIGKIDYHLNDKNTITGEYFWNRDTEIGSTDTVSQLYWATDYFLTGNVARASWTYVPNSTWVNEAHFGFDRKVENSWPVECNPGRSVASPNYGVNSGAATPCLGFNKPTNFALPNISISGFDLLGPSTVQQRRVEGYWSVVDTATHTAGSHNFKFGFELRRPYFSGASYGSASSSVRGQISFGSGSSGAFATPGGPGGTLILATPLESFLDGVPSTGSFLFGNPTAVVRNYAFGTFVQDDWRLTPRLTLNIGLRYEDETALSEDSNKLAVFNPNLGLVQVGTNGLSSPWKQAAFGANLQPRFGAVYDVGGKGKTVIRGAVGIFSNWPVWQVYTNNAALINNPTSAAFYAATGGTFTQGTGTIGSATITFPTSGGTLNSTKTVYTPTSGGLTPTYTAAGPIFPTGSLKCGSGIGSVNPSLPVNASTNPANPGTCAIGTITPNMTLPYANEWTLGIQQSLLPTMSVDIAYVGNHGTNLLGATDLNEPAAGTHDAIRQQMSRPYFSAFPWMGKITQISNKDYSNYNALQVTLNQRNWHGLTSTVGYTYGHALDVTQTDITQNVYPNPLCPECNYGPTGFDIRHRVTGTATYLIPGIKSPAQLLEGWKISTVVNFLGALPYNGSDATSDISGTLEGTTPGAGDRWDLFGNIRDFNSYGRTTPIPCFGAAGSSFAKAGCGALPTACATAAASLGAAGTTQLNTLGCYMAGNSVIVPPAQGTFGTMNQNEFRGAGLKLWDLSLRKQIHFTERIGGEFQFDMYNVTNTPQFAPPSGGGASLTSPGAFGASSATPNVANGNVVQGSGGARRMQFGLKLTF